MDFLEEVGTPLDRWIMCYPYGAHDESIRSLLPTLGCTVGLATHVDIADLEQDDPLALPRVDTNDIPKHVKTSTSVNGGLISHS